MAKLLLITTFLFSFIYLIASAPQEAPEDTTEEKHYTGKIYTGLNFIEGDPLHVVTTQGELVGKQLTNENGKVYRSYSGIPYAKPPLGKLRFQPPRKPELWKGTLDATKPRSECLSYHLFRAVPIGSEDCLFLNVYVPETTSKELLPVMFWIHGGGFSMGSGNTDLYGPDYLMDYDVVLVTINYRLGALGFLNLDIEEAAGNAGLKDQVAALHWVKDNIRYFGGDPDRVTIFGESAGGASVHYLMLSDITKGLFHRAIAQSGTAISPWALQWNNIDVYNHLLEKLGHPTTDKQEALEFLLQVPAEKFLESGNSTDMDVLLRNGYGMVPSIEIRFPWQTPFLTESPRSKLSSGNFNKVPLLVGSNDDDGVIFFALSSKDSTALSQYNEKFQKLIPRDIEEYGSRVTEKFASEAKKFYFQDEPISNENVKKFVDFVTDVAFARGVSTTVEETVEHSTEPVYYYEYSFGEYGLCQALLGKFNLTGAGHCDELGFLFKNEFSELPKDSPSVITNQKRLLQLWTNFAKTGNPTPETNDLIPVKWEPVTKEKLNYYSIGETLSLGTNPRKENVEFWANLVKH